VICDKGPDDVVPKHWRPPHFIGFQRLNHCLDTAPIRQFDDHMNAHAYFLPSYDFLLIPAIRVMLPKDFHNGHLGLGAGWMQAHHKGLMFWARQALLGGREHSRYVTPEQSGGIEPQTRENFTAEHSMRIWHEPFVLPAA
jgi:hypothetical protein